MTAFFDRAAEGWDERVEPGSPRHLAPLAAGAMHVEPEPERVLEIGTGSGEGALMLAREFPAARVRGVDISEPMIQSARAKVGLDPEGRIHFTSADAAALLYDDESFDLVAQLNMPPFFDEIARVLRPGGSVIVASSIGRNTPFYTPNEVLRRKFERRGIEQVEAGSVADGTFYVGRLPPTRLAER
jgi:ubiquinone/menaquinone biosynthesis C-methylase UbiE